MEHLSLSRSLRRQGSKVTCSVWGAEKESALHVESIVGVVSHLYTCSVKSLAKMTVCCKLS